MKVDTTIYGFLNGQLESVQAQGGATPYPSKVVDCSKAYVDFPAIGASNFFGSTWDSRK
jgi:hypothetical protein